jgi:hypothetical protein
MNIFPVDPVGLDECPALKLKKPALPEDAAPDEMVMVPDEPELESPLETATFPLSPDAVPLPVETSISPLLPVADAPVDREILPLFPLIPAFAVVSFILPLVVAAP